VRDQNNRLREPCRELRRLASRGSSHVEHVRFDEWCRESYPSLAENGAVRIVSKVLSSGLVTQRQRGGQSQSTRHAQAGSQMFPHSRSRGIPTQRAVQPEGLTRCLRQGHVYSIEKVSCGQLRHERAQLEADANPLTFCRTVYRRCIRFRSAHCECCLAMVSRDDHLPASLSNREKSVSALTVATPNPFNKRRARWSIGQRPGTCCCSLVYWHENTMCAFFLLSNS
jgi:hypothetical protein